jgi:hypothetical protein
MMSCRPHYLPRAFSSIFFIAVYLPPQNDADTKTPLNELCKVLSKRENAHPEAVLLVAREFNAGKCKSVLPHFCQLVTCADTGKNLKTTFTPHRDAYKAPSHPLFGKSDHNSILLIPAYKQKRNQEVPVTRSILKWSDDTDAKLQDCLASTVWNVKYVHMALRSIPHQSLASSKVH